jgi:hypothetical protein
LDPRIAKLSGQSYYDRNIVVTGPKYMQSGYIGQIESLGINYPEERQKAATMMVNVSPINNKNRTPFRSCRQYATRYDEMRSEGKGGGYIGIRNLSNRTTAENDAESCYAIDPTRAQHNLSQNIPSDMQLDGAALNVNDVKPESSVFYHNTMIGNYPEAVRSKVPGETKYTFPVSGPVTVSTDGAVEVPRKTAFYLPANHRWELHVIPYVIGPGGVESDLPYNIRSYANVSLNVTTVYADTKDE